MLGGAIYKYVNKYILLSVSKPPETVYVKKYVKKYLILSVSKPPETVYVNTFD